MKFDYERIFNRFVKAKEVQQDEMFRTLGLQLKNLQTLYKMMEEHIAKRKTEESPIKYTFIDEK